jgi:hypothetical protein
MARHSQPSIHGDNPVLQKLQERAGARERMRAMRARNPSPRRDYKQTPEQRAEVLARVRACRQRKLQQTFERPAAPDDLVALISKFQQRR